MNALSLERRSDVIGQRGDFFHLHARRGVELVTGDGRALGDVPEGNIDVKLRESSLHQPRVGHQLFFGFGRFDCLIRELQEFE